MLDLPYAPPPRLKRSWRDHADRWLLALVGAAALWLMLIYCVSSAGAPLQ